MSKLDKSGLTEKTSDNCEKRLKFDINDIIDVVYNDDKEKLMIKRKMKLYNIFEKTYER